METLRYTSVLRFGTYEVDPHAGELRKAGVRIKVQQQPLKLLEILLRHPGEVVTREELRALIWPDESFGDFDQAVNVAIAKLRGALGDSADNPRFIETIPRRGYRFIAEVAVLERDSGKPEPAQEAPATAASRDSVAGTSNVWAPAGNAFVEDHRFLCSSASHLRVRDHTLAEPFIRECFAHRPYSVPGGASAGESLWRYAGLLC